MRHNIPEEFLGVDVGDKRIGIARGSSLAKIAQPLQIIEAEHAFERLAELAQEHRPSGLVIGLPRSLSGAETAQTKIVRQWVDQAKQRIKVPFYWQDEALTSHQAASQIQASSAKVQTGDLDAHAAAIILQDFLDTPQEQRVRC